MPRVGVIELRTDVRPFDVGPGEVRIAMRAMGICHSDVHTLHGVSSKPTPIVLGHEGAGQIVEIGPNVEHLNVGDHVVVSQSCPCYRCYKCQHGQPYLCTVYKTPSTNARRFWMGETPIFGNAGKGTFAEEIVVPATGAVKVADDVPFEIAALFSCGIITGVGAILNTAAVVPGSSVAVIGCGGVGISAIQGAKIIGAGMIVAVDPVPAKREMALQFGATHTAAPEELASLASQILPDDGFDYVFDIVGTPTTTRSAWDLARPGGTAVIVGVASGGPSASFSSQELTHNDKRLLGSRVGSQNPQLDTDRLVAFWRTGRLDVAGMISRRLTFDDLPHGIEALEHAEDLIRQVVTF
jgi:S-(hydroxymethyl)glutathione dehydrogenase / alcohol dehydrogenase